MIAVGQAVDCVTVNESVTKNGPGRFRKVKGRIVFIHPRNRWFLVEYIASGVALREGYPFHDVGRVVFLRKGKAKNENT